jgi:hypothetical protein
LCGASGKCAKNFKSRFYTLVIETNGTAVVIVCVNSAAIRPIVLFVGMELSR